MIWLHVFVVLLLLKATLSQSDGTGSCVVVKIENVHSFDDATNNFIICQCLEDHLDAAEFTKHCVGMKDSLTNTLFFDSLKYVCNRAVSPIKKAFKQGNLIDCARDLSRNETNCNSTELTELSDASNATKPINSVKTDTLAKKDAIKEANVTNADSNENLKDKNSTLGTNLTMTMNTDTINKNRTIEDDVANKTRPVDDVVPNNTSITDVLQVNTSTTESVNKDDVKNITQSTDGTSSSKYEDTSVKEAKNSSSASTIWCAVILSFAAGVLVTIAVKVAYNRYHSRAFVLPPEQTT